MYTPWATLAYALSVVKSKDIILVKQGHTETISSATALSAATAGVSVIGLGIGNNRPLFTLDTATTTTIPVSANSISFINCQFSANFADIVSFFTLTTAKNFSLLFNAFKATAVNMNATYLVDTNTTDNAADGLTLIGNTWVDPDTANVSMIKGDADIDSLVVQGNFVSLGVNNSGPIVANMATGKDLTNLLIGGTPGQGNIFVRLNTANPLLVVTDTTTANSGAIAGNFVRHADVAGELLVTAGTTIGFFNNFCTAANDASGYLLPVADS
jgi:hypothetical protein